MSLKDLFKGTKISNPIFKLKDENVGELINNSTVVFYLESKGVNCTPLVKKGDEVIEGQVIGKEKDDFSIPLISSVSGTILEINDIVNFQGNKAKAIVIGDIKDLASTEEKINYDELEKEELLAKLQTLGLSDINGLPLSLKYRAYEGNKIIVSCYNNEVNLCRNEVLEKRDVAIDISFKILNKLIDNCEIKIVKNQPITSDLVKKEFGNDTEIDNVLIEDLSTLVYLGEAILTGKPKTYEYITVFGGSVESDKVVKVRLGTTLRDLFKGLNGQDNQVNKVVVGGALNGNAQFSFDSGIVSNTQGVLFLNEKESRKSSEIACIRCSKCLRACPENLNPIKLAELWKRGEKEEFMKFGGSKCTECGLCSYVCPSNIELAHKIKTAKNFIK
ncbi:MAG: 4Fe-4S dicluster domain-containing protein [Clostridium sp.]